EAVQEPRLPWPAQQPVEDAALVFEGDLSVAPGGGGDLLAQAPVDSRDGGLEPSSQAVSKANSLATRAHQLAGRACRRMSCAARRASWLSAAAHGRLLRSHWAWRASRTAFR